MKNNRMAGLPKGFFDVTGMEAEKDYTICCEFIRNGYLHGYNIAYPSEVGLQSNYLLFGTAAHGRAYLFEDMGKEKIMLSSDSLATCIRAYLSMNKGCLQYNMMAKVPVYRYRHKKYRRWNHLIYTIFQGDDMVMSVFSLLNTGHDFLSKYYQKLEYSISFYSLFEDYCSVLNCSHEDMFRCLYNYYYSDMKGKADNKTSEYIKAIETIGRSTSKWEEALHNIQKNYPILSETVNKCKRFCHMLKSAGIPFNVNWTNYHAIEYSSGICFLAMDENDTIVADGGSYDYIVNSINPDITHCYSFACSLENISCNETKKQKRLYLVKLDCSDEFYLQTSQSLRKKGYLVTESCSEKSIKKILKKLPEEYECIAIGEKEEKQNKVTLSDGQVIVL